MYRTIYICILLVILSACSISKQQFRANQTPTKTTTGDLLLSSRVYISSLGESYLSVSCSNVFDTVIRSDFASLNKFIELLSTAPYLKELQFSGLTIDRFPQAISGLSHLERLTVSAGSINVIDLTKLDHLKKLEVSIYPPHKIPGIFSGLPRSLNELSINGVILDSIPDGISSLTQIKAIELIRCGYINHISNQFYRLDSLQYIGYSHTTLPLTTEEIKQHFGRRITLF